MGVYLYGLFIDTTLSVSTDLHYIPRMRLIGLGSLRHSPYFLIPEHLSIGVIEILVPSICRVNFSIVRFSFVGPLFIQYLREWLFPRKDTYKEYLLLGVTPPQGVRLYPGSSPDRECTQRHLITLFYPCIRKCREYDWDQNAQKENNYFV